ncbi:DUF3560 domain-containing protein [Kineosporia sp. NBRC 101731]|uniref:DUF3560 domain-containing protein n=1 Tax=Kineosporia sp. NBRC 101731 TaxID=3032199 RepID=UPI0024A42C32|nr:DUF3560 domain-containing protein [Kineosporia sp. NBRC 101731]GLY33433.1 hypothetical protein Kisp02_67980 [Kineosporia sp. NBRC 101731]
MPTPHSPSTTPTPPSCPGTGQTAPHEQPAQSEQEAPAARPWYLDVDGDWVAVTGTLKGDPLIPILLPRPWVWSRSAAGYVLPRSLKPWTRQTRIQEFLRAAGDNGVMVEVEDTGAVLSEAERRQGRDQRLDIRADRHEHAAEKATASADADHAASRRISDGYPMGQPILIGHRSEGRHRRDLERRDRLDTRSMEARREARVRSRLAAEIRRIQEQGESPVTIGLRIERHQAEIRVIERRLAQHEQAVGPESPALAERTGLRPMSDTYVERSTAERERLLEAVDLDRGVLAALEAEGSLVVYGPHNVNVGDFVFGAGLWHVVRKVNKKTVGVPSMVGGDWLDKLPFVKITQHRRPTDNAPAAQDTKDTAPPAQED